MLSPQSQPASASAAGRTTTTAATVASPPPDGRPAARTPPPRPRYELPVLLAITALSAVLCTWGIDHSVYHTFYAAAVRSMTGNPVAFFFGSFDPGNSITLDKLPGFLWPQALSAMAFGFHPWALVLPQAVERVACTVLVHLLVRRWAGVVAGLLAAVLVTLTPVTVGLGRSIVEDAPFVLLLLLAAEATQRAVERARLRTLLLAGVWVGVAFQCKMLEAWAVLPALAVTYLVAAPTTLRRRVAHVAATAALAVAVSASWTAVAAVVPAQSRPYIDGTTDNSAFGMVVGYNFLTRFDALGVDAADTGSVISGRSPSHGTGRDHGTDPAAGTGRGGAEGHGRAARPSRRRTPGMGDSVLKMFSPGLATQTGWLYPLAACGLVWGPAVAWRRRVPRTDPVLAGHLLWGVWLATFFAAFSFGSVTGHTYYMGVVAVPLAALSSAGLVRAWGAFRTGGRRAWVLPVMTAANVVWCAVLTLYYPHFFGWLGPAAVALCALALVLVAAGRRITAHRPRLLVAALSAGLAAVLLIPGGWSASALSPRYNQPGGMGPVGPSSRPGGGGPSRLTPPRERLLTYLTAHRDGAKYLAAMDRWSDAAPYIIAADAPVLPMGGFTGQVPYPTPPLLGGLVASGVLHYVVLRHPGASTSTGRTGTTAIAHWVTTHCAAVPPTAYGGTAAGGPTLYRCDPGSAR